MKKYKIDYDLGKTNKEEYFDEILPNIKINLEKNNGVFKDENFTPNISSICNKNNPLLKYIFGEKKDEYEHVLNKEEMNEYDKDFKEFKVEIEKKNPKWIRLSSILKGEEIYKNDKLPIGQGFLGDCYVIAFLRGLQKFQEKRYFALFGSCYPEIGYYEIYFFIKQNGISKNVKVFVDDYLLVDRDNIPIFACLKDKDKYVLGRNLLIEKALAKMNGSYFNLRGKYSQFSESLILTGYEQDNLVKNEKWPDDTFDFLVRQLKAKNVVTCGTKDNPKIGGIYGNHMYLALDAEIEKVYNYFFFYQGDLKVIKLNNPWGENDLKDMENFKLDLEDKFINGEKSIIKYNKNNCDNGNVKILEENLKNNFIQIYYCQYTKIEEKEKEKKEDKGDNPVGFPGFGSGSLEESTIKNLTGKRIVMFNAIGIPKNYQELFYQKYNFDIDEGLFLFFMECLKYGTSLETFERFMGINPNQQPSLSSSLFYSWSPEYYAQTFNK